MAFIDRSKVELDDDGQVRNASALIADLKTAKPFAFGGASTTSTAKPPKPEVKPGKVDVTKMSKDEYAAFKSRKDYLR